MAFAAVWIDHKEGRVFHVAPESFDESTIQAPHRQVNRHERRAGPEKNHPQDEQRFFHDVAQALESAAQILILGPSTAKFHFLKYLHKHAHALEPRIVGIETVDHPTDRQIAAYVRRYLRPAEVTGSP
jgi:stalled ribosome rescue protein Dom34